ncbi:MAG TPA: Ig-like domain-containing protein [Longimicrobiales bacterium]
MVFRKTPYTVVFVAALGLLATSACTESSGFDVVDPEACSAISAVVITPSSVSLSALGATVPLSAAVHSTAGDVVTVPMTWTSLNTAIATVAASGVVTARAAGTAMLMASVAGCTPADTVPVTVQQVVRSVDVNPPSASVQQGGFVTLSATAEDSLGNAVPNTSFTWASSNAAVATVNGSGQVTGVSSGSAYVRAVNNGARDSAQVTVGGSSTPPPPPPPGGNVADIAWSDFENGSLAPFTTGSGETSNADIFVTNDPTGRLGGKVVSLHFVRTGGSLDVNRSIRYDHNVGFGQTVYLRGHVVIPTPQTNMTDAMRKLIYVQRRPNDESFVVVKAVGQSLRAEITNNRVFNGGPFPFDTKVSIEVQITTNSSAGASDGIFRIWKDGALVVEAMNVQFLTSSSPFAKFMFGQQAQHGSNDSSVTFDELRYWDNVAIGTKRIGQ